MVETVLILLALLVAGLVCLPVRFLLRWTRQAERPDQVLAVVTVLLGLVGIHLVRGSGGWRLGPVLLGWRLPTLALKAGRGPTPSPKAVPDETQTRRSAEPPAGRRTSRSWTGPRLQDWIGPARRLLAALPGVVRLRRVRITGSWGAGDPARTGIAFGMLQATGWMHPSRLDLRLLPDFTGAGFRGELELRLHLYPGLVVILACRFLAQVAWRTLIHRWRLADWRPRLL
ncbi:MAG: hypothetical protein WDA75_16195 [Candidatus Latescibacterota bacterium]|jgi:hypothetical protein